MFLYDLDLHSESDEVSKVELRYPMKKKEISGTEEVEIPRFEILGSCKGFLLIKHDVVLYLWNPSIRQCTKVLSLPWRYKEVWHVWELTSSGLCYDSSTDDYKAVLAYNGYYEEEAYGRITMVISLKSRRRTSFCFPYELKSGPVVNERLHWVRLEQDENGTQLFPTQQIFYFDPLFDDFVEFPTPLYGDRNTILGLGVLDGCLCVTRYCYNESGSMNYGYKPNIEVLIMKEYGAKESWTTLLFVMSHYDGVVRPYECPYYQYGCLLPLCVTKNGKVLIVVNGRKIKVYNPLHNSSKFITSMTNVFVYEESLVSPDLYVGKNDWRIESADAWNLGYYNFSDRGSPCWCGLRHYGPSWDDIMIQLEEDEDNDMIYDWVEEDFFQKEKGRYRMRIKTKYL